MIGFPERPQWSKMQMRVLNSEPNVIINGKAGSGKTLLACHIAVKKSINSSVLLIVYTKSLKKFIIQYLKNIGNTTVSVMHQYEWRNRIDLIKYDIIILDEFQDFSMKDLSKIIGSSRIGTYLFGDFKQKIYKKNIQNERTITKIEMDLFPNFEQIYLSENYRISKENIWFIASVFHMENEPGAKNHKFKTGLVPDLLQFETVDAELTWISRFIKENSDYKNIGILLKQNNGFKGAYPYKGEMRKDEVYGIMELHNYLTKNNLNVGYKYKSNDFLDFSSNLSVNILTIHSAKGLQFDCVIIPFSSYINDNYKLENLLYVSLTRAMKKIIVTYTGIISDDFHNNIPHYMYKGILYKSEKTRGLITKKSGLDTKIYESLENEPALAKNPEFEQLFKNGNIIDTSDCMVIKI